MLQQMPANTMVHFTRKGIPGQTDVGTTVPVLTATPDITNATHCTNA